MKCRSEKILLSAFWRRRGFSLPEVAAAVVILAFVSASVLTVISRCMAAAADSVLRMQAFEVARDNMEKLLLLNEVQEMIEYGSSYKYPEIQWQNVVETFYEPVSSRMWVQATCSAEYFDTAGEAQKVELTHWLTNLSKEEVLQIIAERGKEKELLAEAGQLIPTPEAAADYVGVDEETIQQWVQNGMPTTDDGEYIKGYLDLYWDYDGSPPSEAKQEVAQVYASFSGKIVREVESLPGESGETLPGGPEEKVRPPELQPQTPEGDGVKMIHGYTIDELVAKGLPRALLEQLYEDLYKR